MSASRWLSLREGCRALYYDSYLTLSQSFQPMAAQFSIMKLRPHLLRVSRPQYRIPVAIEGPGFNPNCSPIGVWFCCQCTTTVHRFPVFQVMNIPHKHYLTLWGRYKMATIFPDDISSGFFLMIMYRFRLNFHWSLFLRVQLTIFQH